MRRPAPLVERESYDGISTTQSSERLRRGRNTRIRFQIQGLLVNKIDFHRGLRVLWKFQREMDQRGFLGDS